MGLDAGNGGIRAYPAHARDLDKLFQARNLQVNLTAGAFPGVCPGVSERVRMSFSLQIEESPPLAAWSFNLTSSAFPAVHCRGDSIFNKAENASRVRNGGWGKDVPCPRMMAAGRSRHGSSMQFLNLRRNRNR